MTTMSDLKLLTREAKFKEKMITRLHQNLQCLYDEHQLFDVTVCIGDEAFQCHGVILASASDFFKASLTSYWCESSSRVIRINHSDVTVESFRLLLDILYKGRDVVTMNTATDILKMAIFLQIIFLQEEAEEILAEEMSPSNCLGIFQLAIQYELEQLGQNAFDLAVAQLDEVCKCEEFISLPKALLMKLLCSDSKNITTDNLFRAVMRWVDADDLHTHHLPELLPFIRFPDLSAGFLAKEALAYRKHTLRDVLFDYIDEALTLHLCGKMEDEKKTQMKILARQHRAAETSDMKNHVVMFGGYLTADRTPRKANGLFCFPVDDAETGIQYSQPLPAGFGQSLSSCVWRNEVYACSGSTQSRYFAVYKPGSGDWETLPDMPRGREKHSMAAVNWNVYVVGGLEEHPHAGKGLAPDILAYNIKTRVWVTCGKLALPLQDTAAAVLGHRIYVFGGQDAGGAMTDTVQCVDTLTGHVYTAGRLPSMTRGARAVSNGGTIYVATTAGQVLVMKENFILADEKEYLTKTTNVVTSGKFWGSSVIESCSLEASLEVDSHRLPESVGVSPEKVNSVAATVHMNERLATISFSTTGNFIARSNFGVYLHGNEMVVCGGEADDELLYDQMGVILKSGKLTHKKQTLINSRAGFCVHVLCMPDEHVGEKAIFTEGTMRYCFTPFFLTEGSRLNSQSTTIGSFDWHLLVRREDGDNHENVGMFVVAKAKEKSAARKQKVTAQFSIAMKATAGACRKLSAEYTFSHKGDYGWRTFTTFDKLTEPYLHNGKVIVDFTVKPDVLRIIP